MADEAEGSLGGIYNLGYEATKHIYHGLLVPIDCCRRHRIERKHLSPPTILYNHSAPCNAPSQPSPARPSALAAELLLQPSRQQPSDALPAHPFTMLPQPHLFAAPPFQAESNVPHVPHRPSRRTQDQIRSRLSMKTSPASWLC